MTDRDTTSIVTAMIDANQSPEFRAGVYAAYKFFSALDDYYRYEGERREEALVLAAHYFNKVPALWLANMGAQK